MLNVEWIRRRWLRLSIQHSTLNIQHSTFRFSNRFSNLLRLIFPEQTGRTEEQDGDQDDEGDGVAIVRELAAADERFDDADDQSSDDSAGHVADPAENRGDEGLEAG